MDVQLNSDAINKAVEDLKKTTAQSIFDWTTGTIKGALENSGVEIKSTAVPVAKSGSEPEKMNWTPVLIGGAILAGAAFLIMKKRKAA